MWEFLEQGDQTIFLGITMFNARASLIVYHKLSQSYLIMKHTVATTHSVVSPQILTYQDSRKKVVMLLSHIFTAPLLQLC